jgi:dihydroxyacid dehydratase/phosphogluconate dehydratase
VSARRLDLLLDEAEVKQRFATRTPAPPHFRRGYYTMFLNHVLQAHEGCDFDFLRAGPDDLPYEPRIGRT